MPTHAASRLLMPLTAALALSGCVKFGTKPPQQLLTIASTSAPAPGRTVSSQGIPTVAVFAPDVPRKLDTMRVPVQVNENEVAYVKEAVWTDTPRNMFQRVLADTISADGSVFVIGAEQIGLHPARRLSGELIDFGVDARTKQAVVTFDAILTGDAPGAISRRRFSASVPVSDIKASRVADPISQAANQVAAQVASWVKGG